MHSAPPPVWQRLRYLREQAGKTQVDIAKMSGIDRTHISKAERGDSAMSLRTIEKYLAAIGYRLAVVTADEVPLEESISLLSAEDRQLVADLARVLPQLPEPLRDDLAERVQKWTARYGGSDE